MIEIFIIFGLVIDTFLITAVNNKSCVENIKTYLGIETLFAIVGCCIGSLLITFIPTHLFKIIGGVLIILLQVINISGYEYPEKINALLLGADTLIVFSTLPWTYIPVLSVSELIMILGGSWIGSKVIQYLPLKDYLANIAMVCIGISLIL